MGNKIFHVPGMRNIALGSTIFSKTNTLAGARSDAQKRPAGPAPIMIQS